MKRPFRGQIRVPRIVLMRIASVKTDFDGCVSVAFLSICLIQLRGQIENSPNTLLVGLACRLRSLA